MNNESYYFKYLLNTEHFPQSVYHRAKHDVVGSVFAGLSPDSAVLDAGCGMGNITGRYCAAHKVTGIDEQKEAIEYCRKNCGGEYIRTNLYKIPFPDDSFDLVLFLDAIEHFDRPLGVLTELKRVLKPGGRILICTMNYGSPLWHVLEHTWHRFFGGPCKPYSKDVHPTPYDARLLKEHCGKFFKEVWFRKEVAGMELFYLGEKSR